MKAIDEINIVQERNTYIEFSVNENIIDLHLLVNYISLNDRVASLAWCHAHDDFSKDQIDRIRILPDRQ